MNLSPPQSQKADSRPISFVLDDQAAGDAPITVDLAIRPEDLTRVDPSRVNVQQTLGGAWGDNFGPGVPMITISGHTGWRRTTSSSGLDGVDRFSQLYDQVFTNWHKRRQDAVKAGQDPDLVQLVFADALDGFAVVVAPNNFILRRSRSRPLLAQYQISMSVLDQNVDQLAYLQFGGSLLNADIIESLGLDSLTASIGEITGAINSVKSWIDQNLVAPVQGFMQQTARLYNAVNTAIRSADGVAASLISVAQMTAQAGLNMFNTFAAVANLPSHIKGLVMSVAGAYSNVFCVLKNALRKQAIYQDYSPLFGTSNCSSTNGGSSASVYANTNPFYSVVPSGSALPISLTNDAQNHLALLAANDPVLSPMSSVKLASTITSISNGMAVSA